MRYFLDFQSDDYGRKAIDEPFGASGINFSLIQKPDGMGRDISFSGGETTFEFTKEREHELKQLLYYKRKFGFEAIVVLTIEIDAVNKYTADLDFATSESDDLEYFKCKAIEDGKLQIVKGRKSVKVDVLSNTDIDGNYIAPLIPQNILMLAKPVIQVSKWENLTEYAEKSSSNLTRYFSPVNLVKSDLQDSFQPLQYRNKAPEDFLFLTALNNAQEPKILLKWDRLFVSNLQTNFSYALRFIIKYGVSINTATTLTDENIGASTFTTANPPDFKDRLTEYSIPFLNRGESVWIYFFLNPNLNLDEANSPILNIKNLKYEISAQSIAFNSISQSVRLVDVMSQVIRSISGLDINAPRFEAGGQFYDNRLVNGNFLRGRQDKPFTVSLEDLERSFPEFKGDYEIGSDGKVFFGIEEDFYTGTESGFFDNTQFSGMSKTFNPKFTVNEFSYKYNQYQSLKEAEEINSADLIHGESKLVFFNKNVENKKEVEVQWIRDAFLIESTRRKAITLTDATASQDDEDLFCIDTVVTTFDNEFTEVSTLQHNFNVGTQKLSLRNNGSINFIALGIQINSILQIRTIDINAGTYRVFGVTGGELLLTRLLGSTGPEGNGIRSTKYTYSLAQSFVPFTNYTDQGFSETTALNAPNSYSNRRYSIARNIYNYYNAYIATCNLFWKSRPVKNTFYKNNGEYSAKFNGITLKENADVLPANPILSPELYNNIIFANVEFEDFIILSNKIRSERGFIRTLDNNNTVIKVYPVSMDYTLLEKELIIKGEEKYEPTRLTISTEFGYILINNETRVQAISYEFENGKLFLFDENRFRLYNGVYWFEVAVNGTLSETLEDLKRALALIV